jgi:hypothetical protein
MRKVKVFLLSKANPEDLIPTDFMLQYASLVVRLTELLNVKFVSSARATGAVN